MSAFGAYYHDRGVWIGDRLTTLVLDQLEGGSSSVLC